MVDPPRLQPSWRAVHRYLPVAAKTYGATLTRRAILLSEPSLLKKYNYTNLTEDNASLSMPTAVTEG
jgi:hypothetical protein